MPPRIYAGFNGLVAGAKDPPRTAVVLDTFGSLRDLANAGIVLRVGLPLIACDESDEDEDLEGHGTAQYDASRGWWVIGFDAQGVRYVPAGDLTQSTQFLCVKCRVPPDVAWQTAFRAGAAGCPFCGTSLLAPIAPPGSGP